MGKGLFLSISNQFSDPLEVSYGSFCCVKSDGDSGSDFRPITGTLGPGEHFSEQYIEADAGLFNGCSSKTSTFKMSLRANGDNICLEFVEKDQTWVVMASSVISGSLKATASFMAGDQYRCKVVIEAADRFSSANWMSGLDDQQRLFDVLLPGTHDSGTYAFTDGDINLAPFRFVQCHDYRSNFMTQLRNGIRFLDLRVRKVGETLGDNLALFHGDGYIIDMFSKSFYLNVNLGDALQAVDQFLRENPSETVIASIKREDGPTENARSDIGPQDIQGYIDRFHSIRWVAGHLDFATIVKERKERGKDNLNSDIKYILTTTNPRLTIGLAEKGHRIKLNHDHLVVGDVRGKVILLLRDMPNYETWNSNIAALEFNSYLSNGAYVQDNYEGPEYIDKKKDILTCAMGVYGACIQEQQLSVNFLSAASTFLNPASSPVSFALTINAGLPEHNYETDDYTSTSDRSPSLKTLLSPGGKLYEWNLEQRKLEKPGLRGVMAGDFLLTPQSWYNEFWHGSGYTRRGDIPNPNSVDYGVSDHLTRLIWSQNKFKAPSS